MSSSPDSAKRPQRLPRTPDEWLSFGRLVLAAALWVPAFLQRPRFVAAGIVLSAGSDIGDGLISRLRGSRSTYARQLDTIADGAIMLSSLGWLALCRPGAIGPLKRTLAAILAVSCVLLGIEWRRYHVFGALHIDSARAAAVVGHLYVLAVLWRNAAPSALRRSFQCLAAGAALESAWVICGNHLPTDRNSRPLLSHLVRQVTR
ncbi:MAG: CDP-alcohol phosphatidyltransferase family protein [Thermomicrobiales bacterium]|nr:CDP-alcohol phosphatidyltransferase family protein [Thermomicrobiales bacterium]MCO5220075.1 CDP-alcohol phosphatidyltransferase family protein [Thermomicrobiales bacterium]